MKTEGKWSGLRRGPSMIAVRVRVEAAISDCSYVIEEEPFTTGAVNAMRQVNRLAKYGVRDTRINAGYSKALLLSCRSHLLFGFSFF